jgi:hypothetical protein
MKGKRKPMTAWLRDQSTEAVVVSAIDASAGELESKATYLAQETYRKAVEQGMEPCP